MTHKTDETEDLRVRRTRKMLLQAMIDLTIEKGFPAVTVSDIAERAMVNRATFYRHYLDKFDLLDCYMKEVFELTNIFEDMTGEESGKPHEGLPIGLLNYLRHIQQHSAFYRVMLGGQGDPTFVERFRRNSENHFRDLIHRMGTDKDPNAPPLELRLNYISCASIGAILWWLEHTPQTSVESLARWLTQLSATSTGIGFTFKPA